MLFKICIYWRNLPSFAWNMYIIILGVIGVWIDTYVFYQSVLQKKTWIANLVIVFCDL